MRDIILPRSPEEMRRLRKRITVVHAVTAAGFSLVLVGQLILRNPDMWSYVIPAGLAVWQSLWLVWDFQEMKRLDRGPAAERAQRP